MELIGWIVLGVLVSLALMVFRELLIRLRRHLDEQASERPFKKR